MTTEGPHAGQEAHAVDRLAHRMVLAVWGEEPCGIVEETVREIVRPEHRRFLRAAMGLPANDGSES